MIISTIPIKNIKIGIHIKVILIFFTTNKIIIKIPIILKKGPKNIIQRIINCNRFLGG